MYKTSQWKSRIDGFDYSFSHEKVKRKHILTVNGEPIEIKGGFLSSIIEFDEKFMFYGKEARFVFKKGVPDVAVNGVFLQSGKQYIQRPAWVMVFIVLCGLIPIVALGGVLPVLIGFGGIALCVSISKTSLSTVIKVFLCIVSTIAVWLALLFLIIGIEITTHFLARDDNNSDTNGERENQIAQSHDPDTIPELTPSPGDEQTPFPSEIERILLSNEMRIFERENAVTTEQERYLLFGSFVMVNNRESPRILALGGSASHAVRLLSDFWNITDRNSALEQLESLSSATQQSLIANDIYHTLVLNHRFEFLDGVVLYFNEYDPVGLENVFAGTIRRVEQMDEELEIMMDILEIDEEYRDDAFELLVYMQFAERINNGLDAYQLARDMLIYRLGYTEEELSSINTLAAWDYGRTAIIARYGIEAGYLYEDEVWKYLKATADSASETYSSWREYTAAHILGRALAFGNDSNDFIDMLDFMLNHPESPFETVSFK
ncbi:MAG: DUF1266 domain-containing protein [Oscillospiraceae bacterium]|jgi:hypothetical protein|nr:DUF1266 domain-containing protein [Oscillospiraceae bacterium]